jgi:O-antigen ligase
LNIEANYNHSFLGFYFIQFCIILPFLAEQKKQIKTLVLFSIINFIALMLAGLSTAVAILFLCILIALLIRFEKKSLIFKLGVFGVFFIALSAYQLSLDFVINTLPEEIKEAKMAETDNIDYSSFDKFMQTYRIGVYYDSWTSFTKFPIWGDKTLEFGQHSAILDKLGLFGIVGTLLFFILYFLLFKSASSKILNPGLERKFFNYTMIILFVELLLNPLDIFYTEFFVYYGLFLPLAIKYVFSFFKIDDIKNKQLLYR